MRKNWMVAIIIAVWIPLACVGDAPGRIIVYWPYSKLMNKSDLVVIVQVVSVEDARKSDKPPKDYEDDFIGVDTTLRVLSVLKGKHQDKEIILFHFRQRPPKEPGPTIEVDGPLLLSFGGKKKEDKDGEYLLYLKKRADGRYECVSGQVDPILSLRRITNPFPIVPPDLGPNCG